MTDNEKVPYIQCLCHTGKKVYKYWLIALAAIGVIIGLGWGIVSVWKQITEVMSAVGNALNSIGYVLSTTFNNVWSLLCIVPWYWWVVFGVIAGPFILVTIYCAGRHYNVKGNDVLIFVVIITSSIAPLCGIFNCCDHAIKLTASLFDLIICVFSFLWWVMIIITIMEM